MKMQSEKLLPACWLACLIVLVPTLAGEGGEINSDISQYLSVIDEHDHSSSVLSLMKTISWFDGSYTLERGRRYSCVCNFTADLYKNRINVVTFMWMSQAQSNAFGSTFTKRVHRLWDLVIGSVLQNISTNMILSANMGMHFSGCLPLNETECPSFQIGSEKPSCDLKHGLHFHGFVVMSNINGRPLVAAAVFVPDVAGRSMRLMEIENNIGFNCEFPLCHFKNTAVLYTLEDFTSHATSVDTFLCSVTHSAVRCPELKHLTVTHFPFTFVINDESANSVKARINTTANITLNFDLPTATDHSYYVDRHKRVVSDVRVICFKIDRYAYVNKTIISESWQNTGKLQIHSELEKLAHFVRVAAHVGIDIVDEDDYGDYACTVHCVFFGHADTTYGCSHILQFSVIAATWRRDNVLMQYVKDQYKVRLGASENRSKILLDNYDVLTNFIRIYVFITLVLLLKLGHSSLKLRIKEYWREYCRNKNTREAGSFLADVPDACNRSFKYDVFLSYAPQDKFWVDGLYKELTEKNYIVFMDDYFPYGCSITKALATAVSCSRKFVAIMSPDYTSSRLGELQYADKLTRIIEKEATWNSLLIIKYRQCVIPDDLIPIDSVDYAKNPETFMDRLMVTLEAPMVNAQGIDS